MDALLQDLRYALRALRRTPGFALAAVLTLALGIGANTTVFSVANAFVFRGVDARDPGRVVRLYMTRHSPLGYDDFRYVQEHNRVFSGVTAERNATLAMGGEGGNERVWGALVNGGYFQTLGIPAALGRMIGPGDDVRPAGHPVVVLSHAFWVRRFGADPGMVGRTIRLAGRPYTVIGVAREGFAGSAPGYAPELWAPFAEAQPLTGWNPAEIGSSVYVHARLREGVSRQQAALNMTVVATELNRLDPQRQRPYQLVVESARGLHREMRGVAATGSALLLAVVGGVLLICCANIANLLLARGAARRREIGIRLALGAGRGRLVRQMLTETVLLALGGAAVGMGLALAGVRALGSFLPRTEPIAVDLAPDGRVLIFTLLVALGAALLCGLAPARRAGSTDVASSLRQGSTEHARVRTRLVLAQSLLCTMLLAGALLFLRSLGNAGRIHPGFDTGRVLDLGVDLSLGGYDDARTVAYYQRLLEAARALPGVESASLGQVVPLSGSNMETRFALPGEDEGQGGRATYFNVVAPDYFGTLGIRLVEGRELAPGAADEVIVNRALVARTWPEGGALGRQLMYDGTPRTVVGVAADARYVSRGEDPRPTLYLPHAATLSREMTLHVRTTASPAALRGAVRSAAEALDPALPLPAARTLEEDTRISLLPARLGAILLGAFGGVALLLAAVGIYGVVSHSVAQRTREIGIRTALGATRPMLLRMVIGGGLRPVLIGTGVGILLAMVLTRAAQGLLYGVSPLDPTLLLGTPLVLLGTALLAMLLPARRATRVDPLTALRTE